MSHPTRMATLRTLAAASGEGLSSGELADAAQVPRNLMSSHLAVLDRAGIIEGRRSGRSVVYTLVEARLNEIAAHVGTLASTETERR